MRIDMNLLCCVISVSDAEISEEDRKTKVGLLKKKAMNASVRFRNSISIRGRTSSSKVLSIDIEDVHDLEEIQAVDSLRQALILEELLPFKHDDYHKMLRFLPFSCSSGSFVVDGF